MLNKEKENGVGMRELTLRDIYKAVLDRIVFVAIVPFVAVLITAYISWNVLPPIYTATTTMYVLNRTSEDAISYTDINTSTLLVNDYQALASSNRVKDGAAELIGLDDLNDYEVSISLQSSTRLISVNVEGRDPAMTANVANAIATKLSECIIDVMKVENISMIDVATPPDRPSGPPATRNTIIAGLIGLIASVGIVTFAEVLNTKIRTTEDVEKLLNLPVLTQVPTIIDM